MGCVNSVPTTKGDDADVARPSQSNANVSAPAPVRVNSDQPASTPAGSPSSAPLSPASPKGPAAGGISPNDIDLTDAEKLAEEQLGSFVADDDGYFNEREKALYEKPRLTALASHIYHTKINWRKGDLLGAGAFGSVFQGFNADTGELMGVKQVTLDKVRRQGGGYGAPQHNPDVYITALEKEIELLRTLEHENIVRYLGSERTDEFFNIFLEFVPGGSLASLLKKYGAFSEMVTKKYTYQILRGLEYLHAHQIMHRDIKGANVLADDHGLCKLADFGASVLIENEDQHKSLAGTPFWMAPEIIKQNGHGRQADIWSVGCTVLEMLSGQVPWSSFGSSVSVMYKIANTEELPPMPATISPEARDLILKCLQRDPRQRPNAVTLLQHPFLAGVAELMQVKSGSLSRASRMPLDDALIAEAGANVQAARFAAQQQELQMLKQQHQQQQLQFQLQQQQHQQQLQNLNAGNSNNTGSQRPKGLLAGGTGLVTGSSGAVTGSAVAFANVFPQFSGISNPNAAPQPSPAPLVGILAAANTGLATPSSANPSGNAGGATPAGVDFQSIPGLTPDMARALQMASTTPNGVAPELLAAALAGGSVVTMSSPFRARREQMRQRGTLGVVSSGALNSNVPLASGEDPSSMPASYSAGLPSGGNSVPLSGGSLGRAGGAAAAAMHGRTTPPESGNDGGEVMDSIINKIKDRNAGARRGSNSSQTAPGRITGTYTPVPQSPASSDNIDNPFSSATLPAVVRQTSGSAPSSAASSARGEPALPSPSVETPLVTGGGSGRRTVNSARSGTATATATTASLPASPATTTLTSNSSGSGHNSAREHPLLPAPAVSPMPRRNSDADPPPAAGSEVLVYLQAKDSDSAFRRPGAKTRNESLTSSSTLVPANSSVIPSPPAASSTSSPQSNVPASSPLQVSQQQTAERERLAAAKRAQYDRWMREQDLLQQQQQQQQQQQHQHLPQQQVSRGPSPADYSKSMVTRSTPTTSYVTPNTSTGVHSRSSSNSHNRGF